MSLMSRFNARQEEAAGLRVPWNLQVNDKHWLVVGKSRARKALECLIDQLIDLQKQDCSGLKL